MGCDYYIYTDLVVYYKNGSNERTYIPLQHERGYYYDISVDSDEDGYDEKIQEQLHHLPNNKTWEDIAKVVKKESRYERD